ncbi:MAG: ATP-binding protein [Cyanobacteria bacterium J06627_3]
MRWFNTAGPCRPEYNYMLPPLERLPKVHRIINQQGYFVIHAPRQVGKTTAMLTLAQQLTASGQYTAIMVSAEVGAAFLENPARAEQVILGEWRLAANFYLPAELQPPSPVPDESIGSALQHWAESSPRPLVIFIDEIDSLQNEVLASLLRQLRSGYPRRPGAFPASLALIGLRDVRDYKIASGGSDRLNTASPFNIKVASLTIRNFTQAEIAQLYQQHTDDTGQQFTPEAINRIFELTQGQPWLVNAIAKEIVEELAEDPAKTIDVSLVNTAKEVLIKRRDTHIDSLAERLNEQRVRAIIEPMLLGQTLGTVPNDDVEFLLDLGLCRIDKTGNLTIANPIYREILPRFLTFTTEVSLGVLTPSWLTDTGELDTVALRDAFIAFWRQNGQPLLKGVAYHEIAPHIVMMAFLHRVINGGGTLEREYAIGSGRMDLCLRYGAVTLAIELKVWRQGQSSPLQRGLEQLDQYLSGLGLDSGWLVIFDQREDQPSMAERTRVEQAKTQANRSITVIYG